MSAKRAAPAFPLYGVSSIVQEGMTMRDYFAAKIMAQLVHAEGTTWETDARNAYAGADAMLAERDRPTAQGAGDL